MNRQRYFLDLLFLLSVFLCPIAEGAFLERNGIPLYPIGFYELPEEDTALERMAQAGVNLVRCQSRQDLDRIHRFGMSGVFPLSVQEGTTDSLRQTIESVKDHPALAVWEGPDEIIWTFTAYSGLHRTLGVYPTREEWTKQSEIAVEYSNSKAGEILPKMLEGIALVRELDDKDRPVWINEAIESDARFVRQYLDAIDITGCDIYPVNDSNRRLTRVTEGIERWKKVGRGKPVWMVLQAFSWDELGEYHGGGKARTYPTFEESRFMAYTSLIRGAQGILYWGSDYLQSDEMRESIYALTSELASLQTFLMSSDRPLSEVEILDLPRETEGVGVQCLSLRSGEDRVVLLVNEDEVPHLGVEVSGLENLNGRELHLLYGKESLKVRDGEIIVRMQPHEVRVYSTDRKYESSHLGGRQFGLEPPTK